MASTYHTPTIQLSVNSTFLERLYLQSELFTETGPLLATGS